MPLALLLLAALPNFTPGPAPDEQVRWTMLDFGIRICTIAPKNIDSREPTEVILFATPNGSTIEQTLGGKSPTTAPIDWHYDIQNVAAQARALRAIERDTNVVLAVTDTPEKSWPSFRKKHADFPAWAARVEEEAVRDIPGSIVHLTVTGHSGGGSFIFATIEHVGDIPANVDRIAFLDANYNFSDETHYAKLYKWLRTGETHWLIVIAYDDREITLNGKKVLSPTGGTYRASHRMIDRFSKDVKFDHGTRGPFDFYSAMDGRLELFIHPNPQNIILHTRLVGEMNGLLEAMTANTPLEGKWGTFGGPRAYVGYMVAVPATQPFAGEGGVALMESLASRPTAEREKAIAEQVKRGKTPAFMKQFKTIRISARCSDGKTHTVEVEVSPDYLSVGSDADFVRTPLTPAGAMPILASLHCALPTRKLVDEIDKAATVRLAPSPLTVNRETLSTFLQHNAIIESQRAGKPLGELVAGIKKDVVFTNRLNEKPGRLAIYGWRKLDGKPIQPLTIVHADWYVDYSHGIRLVKEEVKMDGKAMAYGDVLRDPVLSVLLSDEGTMDIAGMYRPKSTTTR